MGQDWEALNAMGAVVTQAPEEPGIFGLRASQTAHQWGHQKNKQAALPERKLHFFCVQPGDQIRCWVKYVIVHMERKQTDPGLRPLTAADYTSN